uniref:Uncharacterized protein n=1 Tax=Salix viminalis TaxID=40686 RepID=A0A6N2L349_SALVM
MGGSGLIARTTTPFQFFFLLINTSFIIDLFYTHDLLKRNRILEELLANSSRQPPPLPPPVASCPLSLTRQPSPLTPSAAASDPDDFLLCNHPLSTSVLCI